MNDRIRFIAETFRLLGGERIQVGRGQEKKLSGCCVSLMREDEDLADKSEVEEDREGYRCSVALKNIRRISAHYEKNTGHTKKNVKHRKA